MDEIDSIRALLGSKPRPVSWQERRNRLDEIGSHWPPAADVRLEKADIDGIAGEWSFVEGGDPERVLMFFHGGGYCSGSILSHRRMVTEAGRAAGSRTLAVGYRLAPEHPFPAAFDDTLTAWRFLRALGVPAQKIALGGDSAGGGLVLALLQHLRDAGEDLPGCAWLASPWTDMTMSGMTLATKDAEDPLIHEAYLEELAEAYAPQGMDRRDPRLSALYAELRGLPPLLIQVGSAETLLADFNAPRRRRGSRRSRGDARDLAAHDPRLAGVERGAGAGRRALAQAGAFIRRRVKHLASLHLSDK